MGSPTTVHRLRFGLSSNTKDDKKHKYEITKLQLIKHRVKVFFWKIKKFMECPETKTHDPPNLNLTVSTTVKLSIGPRSDGATVISQYVSPWTVDDLRNLQEPLMQCSEKNPVKRKHPSRTMPAI